jgi:hypothetical protein
MTDCYNNLWLVLYDEDKHKYTSLADVNAEIKEEQNKKQQ